MNEVSGTEQETVDPEIRTQAAAWAVELQTTDFTLERWGEFESWCSSSEQHRAAYGRAERAWRALNIKPALEPVKAPRDRTVIFVASMFVVIVLVAGAFAWATLTSP